MAAKRRKRKKQPGIGWLAALILLLAVLLVVCIVVDRGGSLPQINPYREDDFAYENGFLTCLTTESVPGIDVSYYQGDIDWNQVRQAGVEFAFVRVGYRSTADGLIYEDDMARKNLREAAEAGIKVGAYFFSQALTPEEAAEEGKFAVAIAKEYPLELPLAYDWEPVSGSERTDTMTKEVLTDCVEAFSKTVEGAGFESMVYFNRDLAQTLLDVRKLGGRAVWFAMYDSYPDAPCKPDYWQYTDKGTVAGIDGYVDLNIYLP